MIENEKDFRPRLSKEEFDIIKAHRKVASYNRNKNVLIIGDLHTPFDLDEYFDFCLEQYIKYNCNQVIFIGDIIDNHFSSFHTSDADGMSAGDELELSVKRLQRYHKAFPNATVILGNHDRIIMRKALESGVSKRWLKDFKDVLSVPTWNFTEELFQDEVLYIHGEGGTARNRIKQEMHSIVQGHRHTEAYVDWLVGSNFRVFGMQVGTGIDRSSYAFAYAKNFKKQIVSCGVVLENGKLPILIPMEL